MLTLDSLTYLQRDLNEDLYTKYEEKVANVFSMPSDSEL